ncbi:class I SAM-dependent methyltransferase [Paenibacillus sp. SAFN-117]|uniref:class I SAM-dependent methyltransferase n=1 Tax=Paenibacillus sp. SAFN-117 TaxID=3436860 RepID=UPI003F81FE7F
MTDWKEWVSDSQKRWEENASYWDERMGEESNSFYRDLIRPHTERLLEVQAGQRVVEVACGNGIFARRLADLGVKVVAFDYSETMIERAQIRSADYGDRIDYRVMDGTDLDSLLSLGVQSFDAAVANMAIMDMAEMTPLMQGLYELLKPGGVFVFSVLHPCFQTPGARKVVEEEEDATGIITRRGVLISKYIQPETYEGLSLRNQPIPTRYFHRPLSELVTLGLEQKFVLDGMAEPVFRRDDGGRGSVWEEIPPVLVVRFRKLLSGQ